MQQIRIRLYQSRSPSPFSGLCNTPAWLVLTNGDTQRRHRPSQFSFLQIPVLFNYGTLYTNYSSFLSSIPLSPTPTLLSETGCPPQQCWLLCLSFIFKTLASKDLPEEILERFPSQCVQLTEAETKDVSYLCVNSLDHLL